ncbi:hypothetical protein BLMD_14190 [Bacillus paralicheniformis]|nr:hypothetical protein BLMD_14190 [Bacillus paralicheniformis]KJD55553.1 hypothetical protein UZ38_21675 [Bacillus amyloliquefaciens]KUL11067.1 hypothetical protein LI7559_10260 [Bacillus licheniformis LMG 7559]POO81094.1 hypothetical protein C1T30_20370 [Bacillus sp. MBGLi97]AYQ17177.1 hypothetical protein D5285_14415 [Bacillus paralicheniformis]
MINSKIMYKWHDLLACFWLTSLLLFSTAKLMRYLHQSVLPRPRHAASRFHAPSFLSSNQAEAADDDFFFSLLKDVDE